MSDGSNHGKFALLGKNMPNIDNPVSEVSQLKYPNYVIQWDAQHIIIYRNRIDLFTSVIWQAHIFVREMDLTNCACHTRSALI